MSKTQLTGESALAAFCFSNRFSFLRCNIQKLLIKECIQTFQQLINMQLLTNFLRLFFSVLSLSLFSSSISSCACLSASYKKKWEEIYFQFPFPRSERGESVPPQPVLLFSDVALNHNEENCRDNNLDGCSGWAHPGLHECLERKKINQIEANCAVRVQSECFTEESRCDEVQDRASVHVFHN